MKQWKKDALHLWATTDLSKSEIARRVQQPRTTVRDFLIRSTPIEEYVDAVDTKPRVLIFDIETTPLKAYTWGLWNQNIGLSQIIEDWHVLCWSAKWLEEDAIESEFPSYNYKECEKRMVENLWTLLDEAEVVVAHNGKRFDVPKMNAKFLQYGLHEPSPYKVVDTLKIAKAKFKFTSNKLDYIANFLEMEGKHSTDFQLWIDCMDGDPQAINRMVDYCEQDVRELEKVYLALRGWDQKSPNMGLLYNDDSSRCSSCGSTELEVLHDKKAHTGISSFTLYRCTECGKLQRDGTTTVSKEKRQNLMRNIS